MVLMVTFGAGKLCNGWRHTVKAFNNEHFEEKTRKYLRDGEYLRTIRRGRFRFDGWSRPYNAKSWSVGKKRVVDCVGGLFEYFRYPANIIVEHFANKISVKN